MVEALIARGSHVIAIARNRVALNEIERLGANVIAGDVTEA
jgi:uncharacterized protein YbjT (DUF2867 family)